MRAKNNKKHGPKKTREKGKKAQHQSPHHTPFQKTNDAQEKECAKLPLGCWSYY